MKLPRRLAMSQVGLVDDHTLHQPCVQSLLFKSRLCVMDASSLGTLSLAYSRHPPRERSSICLEVESLPVTSRNGHTHTHTHAYYLTVIYVQL